MCLIEPRTTKTRRMREIRSGRRQTQLLKIALQSAALVPQEREEPDNEQFYLLFKISIIIDPISKTTTHCLQYAKRKRLPIHQEIAFQQEGRVIAVHAKA